MVNEYEKGRLTVGQLSVLHGIAPAIIYRWIYKFSTFNESGVRIVEMKDSTSKKVKDLEKRVKDLERMVGQKQIKIDFLEKMMDIAKSELNIDIKKNFSTPPSDGSETTERK